MVSINNSERKCHIDLLRKYFEKPDTFQKIIEDITPTVDHTVAAMICPMQDSQGHILPCLDLGEPSNLNKISIESTLTSDQQDQVMTLIHQYKDVITNKPG